MSSEKDTIDSAGIPSDQDIHQNTNRTTEDFKQLKTIASLRRDSSSLDEKNIKGDVQDIKIAEIGDDTALDVENDVELVLDKARGLTIEECRKLIKDLLEEHTYDYNFAATQKDKLRKLLDGPAEGQSAEEWEILLKKETALNIFYSP